MSRTRTIAAGFAASILGALLLTAAYSTLDVVWPNPGKDGGSASVVIPGATGIQF
jgi:hypothetical protein